MNNLPDERTSALTTAHTWRLRIGICLLLALAAMTIQAQIPDGYYNSINNQRGQELRIALHNIIKGHHVVSYDGLKSAYFYTDAYSDGKLWDIYSNYHWTSGQSCGSYSEEGDCWNREHSWPQSWFGSGTPKSDLFHVYPTDGKVNGMRSSYPYGEVGKASYTSKNGSKLGTCSTDGYSGTVFEPINEYKGDIARSYFYMSTRYYGEDSSWSSSGMTNKCEIKAWAMKMLLRWHKEDPVSQKEIDRNNVIYESYQHNRNPFIDHPEYAEMIWDENWSPKPTYNITSATNLSGGTVSAPYSAIEGSTVAITATPKPGYAVSGYSAWKTGDTSTPVTVSTNGTFTMPAYPVTVSASFERDSTQYAITLATVSNGTISASTTTALFGSTITLTATPDEGYSLSAIYVFKTGDINTQVDVTNSQFTMPSYNVTVSATFVQGSFIGTGDFVKVTSALSDWSGEYLIVCEKQNLAFNGELTTLDTSGNSISVTINNNTIVATEATNKATFTIAKSGSKYTICSNSGMFIGQTSDANGLQSSASTDYTNTITYNNNAVDIVGSGGAYLRYNNGAHLFRYYKSSSYTNQQSIQLYKRDAAAAPAATHTVTFYDNTGAILGTQTVNEMEATALDPAPTKDGYEFDGWTTNIDGTGDYYADGANVTLINDLDLYAKWEPLYAITVTQSEHGTISASASAAVFETTIELTATPAEGYQFSYWTVTDANGEPINVIENTFEMPASAVSVTATFVPHVSGEVCYKLITSSNQLVTGQQYLIVNTDAKKALSTTQKENNRGAASVSISNGNTITELGDACELTLGGSIGAWTFYDPNLNGYLYAASSSSNHLKTRTVNNDDNGKWSITVNTSGIATIQAQGSNSRNLLRYNNDHALFSCYASGQQEVSLFVRIMLGDINSDGSITIADITALVNIILGKDDDEPHQYNHVAADVNADGFITIADVTALINIILDKP